MRPPLSPSGIKIENKLIHNRKKARHEIHLFYFVYLFLAAPGSSLLCTGFSLVMVERGYSSFGAWASHCGGISCCRAQALGLEGQ